MVLEEVKIGRTVVEPLMEAEAAELIVSVADAGVVVPEG